MLDALAEVLSADLRIALVGTVQSGEALRRLTESTSTQVVVVDVRMPGGGAAGVRALRALTPAPAVVVVSANDDFRTVSAMVRAGAACYLAKDRLGGSLAEVVVRAARGEAVLSVGCGQRLIEALGAAAQA